MSQLHKKFTTDQIKELIERYLKKEIKASYIQKTLGIGKTRWFALIKKYRQSPAQFSIQYLRKNPTRKISKEIEDQILLQLNIEKELIKNPEIPVKFYNYSYIRDILTKDFDHRVSLNTIIDRAKKNDCYLKKSKRSVHDRMVLTNHIGELIQHDSSVHLFAPYANEKWYLITSLDDFSRFILFAKLYKKETSWSHIQALQTVILKYGLPHSYYVDSHSIFRFVQGRDSNWRLHKRLTDDVSPQWKQVLEECSVQVIYALSAQAKGKIERPYGWIQDRLVRTCAREKITDLNQAQIILNNEIKRYNFKQVHSTTKEVPHFRFKKALQENLSLFRAFQIRPPFKSFKDIFCLRLDRTANAYRKISINNLDLPINKINPHDFINLRIYPLNNDLCEVRFWRDDELIDIQKIKKSTFKGVHF